MMGFVAYGRRSETDYVAANGVLFDGTNDYMLRGADLTGNADGKAGMFSCWIDMNGGDGAAQYFTQADGGYFAIQRDTVNNIQLAGFDAAAVLKLGYASAATFVAASGWQHVLLSWDLAVARIQCYIDDAADAGTITANVNAAIDYTRTNWAIGAVGAGKINAYVAEYYLNLAASLDLSVASNRRKFITSDRKPVDLGVAGATPTGTAPIVYLKGPAASFATNLGSGGNFSITGTLTDGTNGP